MDGFTHMESWPAECAGHHWHIIHQTHGFNGKKTDYRCCHCGSVKTVLSLRPRDVIYVDDRTDCGKYVKNDPIPNLKRKIEEIYRTQRKKYGYEK